MSMLDLDNDLQRRLAELRQRHLHRQLRPISSPQGPRLQAPNQSLLNLSSNDYLGLANHPALKEAARQAIADFGVGAGASRLICGSLAPHHQLEEAIAQFKNTAASLTFSTGYAAALGTLQALLEPTDVVILDKRIHACLVDAARLSRAKMRVYGHNDLDELQTILQWASQRGSSSPASHPPRILIVTESVFSMDGDLARLKEIVELKHKYGAWLMLDEAHATGCLGNQGRGWADACQVGRDIDVQMGTLGKALGAAGGFVCGSRTLIDFLINRARTFIFSTAPPPAVAAAATTALEIVQSNEGAALRTQLWTRVDEVRTGLERLGWAVPQDRGTILPLIVGEESAALGLADQLRAQGVLVPAIRYPTVPRGAARLRLTLTAAHSSQSVALFLDALSRCQKPGAASP